MTLPPPTASTRSALQSRASWAPSCTFTQVGLDMMPANSVTFLPAAFNISSSSSYQALKRAVKNRGKAAPVNIGGYTNFLFLNQSGLPKTASCYESMFQGLVRKYNKHHKPDEALPNITPHTMRHTFCTRLAHAGMNPKDLQYIMGHSNITMTLNYYAHADYASAKAAMDRLAA